jgi:hypothetical protein
MGYTNLSGSSVQPADVGYRAVSLVASTTLVWPPQSQSSTDYVAHVMDVTASSASLSLKMPDATAQSPGFDVLWFNPGAYTYTVLDNNGGTICTVAPGQAQYTLLTSGATAAGTWKVLQFGSTSSAIAASALVGPGIKASGSSLYAAESLSFISANTTVQVADRTTVFVWTGGAGTLTIPLSNTVGADFFVSVVNQGTGALTVSCSGPDALDGASSQTFLIGDSAVLHASGSANAWYSVGRGRSTQFNFTLLTKSVSTGSYTLTQIEASATVQKYTGALAGNVTVIVPSTVQVYYVSNQTTNAFSLTFATSVLGGATITVPQGQNAVLACDGTNVINTATTVSGLSSLTLAQANAAAPSLTFSGDATTGLFAPGTGAVAVSAGGAEVVRWNATGLGIKKSPSVALDVNGAAQTAGNVGVNVASSGWSGTTAVDVGSTAALSNYSSGASIAYNAYYNGTNWVYKTSAAAALYNQTSGGSHQWSVAASGTAAANVSFTTAMTLDASGNLGLGVTPSTWGAGVKVFQTGASGVGTTALFDLSNNTFLANGIYYDGTNYKYVASSFPVARYLMSSGASTWSYAAGGTAGNPITFSLGMTLDANGFFGLGVTPSAWGTGTKVLQAGAGGVGSTAVWDYNNNTYFGNGLYYDGANYKYIANSFPVARYSMSGGTHTWSYAAGGTAGATITLTTGMVLDSSGRLGLGLTPSAWASSAKVIQTGAGAIGSSAVWDYNNNTYISNGTYFDGAAYRYVANSFPVAMYSQSSGGHQWFTAASGSAGGALSPISVMQITAGGVIQDGAGNELGFKDVPPNNQTTSYTAQLSDRGKSIDITTGGVTIPSGVFSQGHTFAITNNSTSSQTVTQGSGVTLRFAGTSSTGNRTLAGWGQATVRCLGSNVFLISGAGLS